MVPYWWQRSPSRQCTRSLPRTEVQVSGLRKGKNKGGPGWDRPFIFAERRAWFSGRLADLFSLQCDGARTAGRTLGPRAQRTNIDSELLHGPAERVPVHAQLPRRHLKARIRKAKR